MAFKEIFHILPEISSSISFEENFLNDYANESSDKNKCENENILNIAMQLLTKNTEITLTNIHYILSTGNLFPIQCESKR